MHNILFGFAQLRLARCPHCNVASPSLIRKTFANSAGFIETTNSIGQNSRRWSVYECTSCGGILLASSTDGHEAEYVWPSGHTFSDDIPDVPRDFLNQAAETLTSPRASVVMSAGAVDSMLKERGLKDGSLYSRIQDAVKAHLLTPEIGAWAHDVRLDANDQRHADEAAVAPSVDDARRCLEFAKALADTLFVLPARVKRGRDMAQKTKAQKAQ